MSNTSQFQIHFAEPNKGGRGEESVKLDPAALERRRRRKKEENSVYKDH